mmetsp:Transcript_17567/g.26048  ORF Transcript_17567/g.26048 Transcript_17567/m.26048 type:complete len:126 (-) Transcript_17567:73-450(-)
MEQHDIRTHGSFTERFEHVTCDPSNVAGNKKFLLDCGHLMLAFQGARVGLQGSTICGWQACVTLHKRKVSSMRGVGSVVRAKQVVLFKYFHRVFARSFDDGCLPGWPRKNVVPLYRQISLAHPGC